ncbi:hypothetical protein [Xenorhabdus bovienii]|uniref:hypothetical protein n=1 Tax=Xenorhabdus bovienii TaxID=40576 RepID=UPI003DA349BC
MLDSFFVEVVMPINSRDPFGASTPLLRSSRVSSAQTVTAHSQTPSFGADILDGYLNYLIECRFLSADGTGRLTIKAEFANLAYRSINLSNIERYLCLLGFTPETPEPTFNGVKYVQTLYPNVNSLSEYENFVLPAIKAAIKANPPHWF